MIIIKIIALVFSLILFAYGAQKIKTEIGILGFFAAVASFIWLLVE